MERQTITGNLSTNGRLSGKMSVGGGTTDYNELENKPTYNGHVIEGDLTNESLGIWQPKNFSTEEQNTGLKWIDGKSLYQKTYDFGALPNNTMKIISSGLIDVNVVKIDGIAISSNGFTTTIPHPEIGGNGDIQIDFLATNEIRIRTNSDYSRFTGYVTIQYTKTTD